MSQSAKFVPRAISKIITTFSRPEGMGATVRRSIGIRGMRNFTPFLILDHFRAPPGAGFPDHPHRGQETITYMLQGHMDHEDFTGSLGTLRPGDLQFMTAGRGIMHAEMPRIEESDGDIEAVEGLQLWVDLPEHLKDTEPRYRDLRKEDIPIIHPDPKVEIRIISGESHGTESVRDLAYNPVWILDNIIKPGGQLVQPIPKGFSAFLYILGGKIKIQNEVIDEYNSVFFEENGDGVELSVPEDSVEPARFIVIAGKILEQDIYQGGPFVGTTKESISQAYNDFNQSRNGFERGRGWRSEIGKLMV